MQRGWWDAHINGVYLLLALMHHTWGLFSNLVPVIRIEVVGGKVRLLNSHLAVAFVQPHRL